MKTPKASAVLTLATSLILCGNSLALTPVKDNFNEPGLNTKIWKPAQSGAARLRHSDGSLHFTIGPKAHTQPDVAYVELRNNQPGINETWMVRLNAYNISANGNNAGVGFWIFNADDPSDNMLFELYSTEKFPEQRKVASAHFTLNGTRMTTKLANGTIVATKLANVIRNKEDTDLIITFNPKSKLFTFYSGHYYENIIEELWRWTKIGTFSPTGAGGDVQADWKMNPGSGRFGIRLAGFGQDAVVDPGEARISYFALKATNKLPE